MNNQANKNKDSLDVRSESGTFIASSVAIDTILSHAFWAVLQIL